MTKEIKRILKSFTVLTLVMIFLFTGIPSSNFIKKITKNYRDNNIFDLIKPDIKKAQAATFSIQTGYYVGDNTDNRAITGVGFSPDLVLIKDDTTGGNEGVVFKTSSMPSETTIALAETDAVLTTNHIQSLDADGFTIGNDADVNAANTFFGYVAFDGSDCSSSGTFCVGSYTGNGAASASITSVGFQPDLVIVKRSGATQGVWKSSSMAGTTSNYFDNVNELASGGINSLDATGFTVGNNAAVNTSANTYYFVAFKEVAGAMDVGSYTGNATDNRIINSAIDSGLTFKPDFAWIKPSTVATAQVGVFSIRENYSDRSFLFTDATSAANNIQLLRNAGGFEIGSSASANSSAVVHHYAAFAGVSAPSAGTGTFTSNNGSYTGTGSAFSITGLGFSPDLIIIKNNDQATDQHSVFRTSLMIGDRTGYLANAVTVFTGGITAIGNDGFSIGISPTVNTSGDTYYWTAFGNAMEPGRSGGSSDFLIGQYIGTARDITIIDRLPIQADLLTIKGATSQTGVWRTANQTGDQALYFSATALAANIIQAINADGFEIGTNASVNSSAITYDYFIFKDGNKFNTNVYSGNATARNITTPGFQPDHLWIKKTTGGTARVGVLRNSAQTGDAAQPFSNLATLTNMITNLIENGFSLGTGSEVNETGGSTYQFAVWNTKLYTQQAYRFFGNTDGTDVGSALSAQDTPPTLSTSGQEFRLRILTRIDNGNLYTSGETFKLQYVDPGSGTCSSPSGGTPASYTDVTGATSIAYKDNTTPTDGGSLTSNANDPTDGARTIVNQTYEESNDFSNGSSSILNGQTGKWDFSLFDNGATPGTTFCFRMVLSDGTSLDTYTQYPSLVTSASAGALTADIVDSGGTPVASPSVLMSSANFSFTNQTSTGSFGTSGQKIRVDNGTGTATWTLSLAADSGSTAFWDGTSTDYDFNDPTASALDGADADSLGGRMTVDPSGATITPEGGCTLTNISSGSLGSFSEGITDSVTLASAASGADTNCYWDITDIDISQTIPAEQPSGNYSIDMTLSIIAS